MLLHYPGTVSKAWRRQKPVGTSATANPTNQRLSALIEGQFIFHLNGSGILLSMCFTQIITHVTSYGLGGSRNPTMYINIWIVFVWRPYIIRNHVHT